MSQITWVTTCSVCKKYYKNPNPDHEGKEVVCRCGESFLMNRTAPHGNTGAAYDLRLKTEYDEEMKRFYIPLGMLWPEFVQLLYRPAVLAALCLEFEASHTRAVPEEAMTKYIEYLENERERIRSSFD